MSIDSSGPIRNAGIARSIRRVGRWSVNIYASMGTGDGAVDRGAVSAGR
jgi:hypothetical protein